MKLITISKFSKKYNFNVKQLIVYLLKSNIIKQEVQFGKMEVIDNKYTKEQKDKENILLNEHKLIRKIIKDNVKEKLKKIDIKTEIIMDIENEEEKLKRLKIESTKELMFLDFEMGIEGIYEVGIVITKNNKIVEKLYYFIYDNYMYNNKKINKKKDILKRKNINFETISENKFKKIFLNLFKTINYIVAHNANSERKMINNLFNKNLVTKKEVICTANLSKIFFGKELSLSKITETLKISNHNPHFALSDAEITYKVFDIFCKKEINN